jgi:recombination protein RecA
VGVIFGNPEITSGGNALKFYASVRLEVRRKETIKGPAGADDIGIRVKAKASISLSRAAHACGTATG